MQVVLYRILEAVSFVAASIIVLDDIMYFWRRLAKSD